MWKPYLQVIASKAAHAVHVLDRFHVAANMGKAIDEVRATEARKLKQGGYEPVLKHTRFCLLKRPENLTEKQEVTLATLLRYNLKSVRAYLLKEEVSVASGKQKSPCITHLASCLSQIQPTDSAEEAECQKTDCRTPTSLIKVSGVGDVAYCPAAARIFDSASSNFVNWSIPLQINGGISKSGA